jgi:hypothetical protein
LRQIAEKDGFTLSLWSRVKDNLKVTRTAVWLLIDTVWAQVSFTSLDLQTMSGVHNIELRTLELMIEQEVPQLRRLTAPPQYSEDDSSSLDNLKR